MKLLCLMLAAASMASACTPHGFRPPPSDEEAMTSKNRPAVAQVRQALNECGDLQPIKRQEGESLDNARTRVVECMFQKGFISNQDGEALAQIQVTEQSCPHVKTLLFAHVTTTTVNEYEALLFDTGCSQFGCSVRTEISWAIR